MDNELIDFQNDIRRSARSTALAGGNYTRESLLNELAERLVRAEEIPEYTPCYVEGTGSKARTLMLDAYCDTDIGLDASLQVLTLVSGEEHGADSLVTADVTTAYKRAVNFFLDAASGYLSGRLEPSAPPYDLASLIHGSKEAIRTVRGVGYMFVPPTN